MQVKYTKALHFCSTQSSSKSRFRHENNGTFLYKLPCPLELGSDAYGNPRIQYMCLVMLNKSSSLINVSRSDHIPNRQINAIQFYGQSFELATRHEFSLMYFFGTVSAL